MPEDFADFVAIGRNLLSLEINTMISEGITAEKMPVAARALIEIAQDYQGFLFHCIGELVGAGAPPAVPPVRFANGTEADFLAWDLQTGNATTFVLLRRAALACDEMSGMLTRVDASVLARIISSCDQVYGLFLAAGAVNVAIDEATVLMAEEEHKPMPDFSGDGLVALRKIWDIGTSTVVMQTVVQIDGDVIIRVLDGWQGEDAATLHAVHHEAVGVALQRWSFLVQTARDLIGFFLGGGSGPESALRPAPAAGAAG